MEAVCEILSVLKILEMLTLVMRVAMVMAMRRRILRIITNLFLGKVDATPLDLPRFQRSKQNLRGHGNGIGNGRRVCLDLLEGCSVEPTAHIQTLSSSS